MPDRYIATHRKGVRKACMKVVGSWIPAMRLRHRTHLHVFICSKFVRNLPINVVTLLALTQSKCASHETSTIEK